MDLKRGIDLAVKAVVEEIKATAKPASDSKAIEQVGSISANSDTTVGKLIAQAMEKVGKEGVITVEEGSGFEDSLRRCRRYAVRPWLYQLHTLQTNKIR